MFTPYPICSIRSSASRPARTIESRCRTPAATSPRPQRSTTSDNTGMPDLSAPTPSSGRACPQQLQPQLPQARQGTLCLCVSLRLDIWLYLPVVFVRGAYPGSRLLGSPSLIQENEVRQVSVSKAVACTGAIFGVCTAGLVALAGRKVALRGLETTAAECLC